MVRVATTRRAALAASALAGLVCLAPSAAPLAAALGVLTGNSGGTGVEVRCYWSSRAALTVSDLGIEAQLHPGAWGRAVLSLSPTLFTK